MNKICGICGKEAGNLKGTVYSEISICDLCEKKCYNRGSINHVIRSILNRVATLEANQISIVDGYKHTSDCPKSITIERSLGDIPARDDTFSIDQDVDKFLHEKEIPKHSHE